MQDTKNIKSNFSTYCITPNDADVALLVESVNILNEFKTLGFNTRGGFVGVVQDNVEDFKNYKMVTRLFDFWQGRVKDADLNRVLDGLLIQLKNE